jgi:hypothetical protein
MAKKDRRDEQSRAEEDLKKVPTPGQMGVIFIGNAVDKLGVPMAVLILVLFAIRWMGSADTQDKFIQEVLFGSVTHTRHLSVFFASLIVLILISAVFTRRKKSSDESSEMKRIAKEKSELQERLLGKKLSSSAEPMKETSESEELEIEEGKK